MNEEGETCREKLWDGWWHYLPGLVNLGTGWNEQANDSHMTLLCSEEQRGGTILAETYKEIIGKTNAPFAVSQSLHKYLFVRWACVWGQKASHAKCHSGLTQHSAETWATAFHQLGHNVELTDSTGSQERPNNKRMKRWGWGRGTAGDLTFSWSWTLAPFLNRVSTVLACPYCDATVRAVPPSCKEADSSW